MKDIVNERLILLATAQECMSEVADKLELWDRSQHSMERSAFEAINTSDKVLNLSKEGKLLVEQLQKFYLEHSSGMSADEKIMIEAQLKEVESLLHNIMEASVAGNDTSHKIEGETACQKEMKEDIRKSLRIVRESIDSASACAEFMLAEI